MTKQMIYTSCRRGRGTEGSGFQVYSYTDGIGKDVRDKLVKLGAYSLGSTGLKSVSDDYSGYPLAYRYWAGNGCKAMIRSEYLGLDWSGTRVGSNYLAHSIVFDESDETGDAYPVSFIGSESFKKGNDLEYLEQFKSDNEPMALDTLIPVSTNLDFETVCDFVKSQEQGVEIVKTTISELLNGKTIMISDTQENLRKWIAACTMILPKSVAWGISFTTYDSAGKESRFHELSESPSIIGIWLPEGKKRETMPSKLEWTFGSDDNGLFEEYIDNVFTDPTIRENYLAYANELRDINTIEKAIKSFIVYSYRCRNCTKKLLDMFSKDSRSCFDDHVLCEIGCSLLTDETYSEDSLDNVDKLLESIESEELRDILKDKIDNQIINRSKVKDYNDLSDREIQAIRGMLSIDYKDNLLDLQQIAPIIIMVDMKADFVINGKDSHFKQLKYSDKQICELVKQFDSKELLKNYMVKKNKAGYIMKKMPLDPEFKNDVARRYFEDIDNHVDIKNVLLKKPKEFDTVIIKSFYETEGILEKLSNEKDVFTFTFNIHKIREDNEIWEDNEKDLLDTYKDIIEGLYEKDRDGIKPLIETLVRRIDDNNAISYLDDLGDIVRTEYCRIKLVNGKNINEKIKLKPFSEKLENRKDYVIKILREVTEKDEIKKCSLNATEYSTKWLSQLITIYGGPSEEFRAEFIKDITGVKKDLDEPDTNTKTRNNHKQSDRDKKTEKLELQAKCFYIITLIRNETEQYNDNNCSNSTDLRQDRLSSREREIKSCIVNPDDLERYLKDKKRPKDEISNLKKQYCEIINNIRDDSKGTAGDSIKFCNINESKSNKKFKIGSIFRK